MKKIRRELSDEEANYIGIKQLNKKRVGRKNPRYTITEQQLESIILFRNSKIREFVETTRTLDKNGNITSTTEKLQSNAITPPSDHEVIRTSTNLTTGQQWVITAQKKAEQVVNDIDFDSIIKKYASKRNITPLKIKGGVFLFDRLVYTDVHIGMTTNKNGFSLYGGKWDEEEINNRLNEIILHVLSHKKANTLIIDELGDFVDGWDGQTVRRGHDLPQNMDNEKAFDVAFNFKMKLLDSLAKHYTKIICHNICNDNHAGSFAYVVNKPVKDFVEYKYNHIKVKNIRKFIDHYYYGRNCFILSHGKDGKNLKFGFKPILDSKQIEKIKDYIDHHKILLKSDNVEFSKGDSHQKIFDESSSDAFNYYNYGALSPSSEWVQTNFKKGKSFFEFFNFKKDGNKIHNPFVFKWDINRTEEFEDYSL